MKYVTSLSATIFALCLLSSFAHAQDDETRQGTGLPSQVGENVARGGKMNLSGRITLETVGKLDRLPVISVVALVNGVTAERGTTSDTGYYILRNVPRDNITLVVEVGGVEVTRQPVIPVPMGNPRYDFSIPWPVTVSQAKPGVIVVNHDYERTAQNEEIYQNALAAVKAKENKKASDLFDKLLAGDPKDYVAWTELGTLYFNQNSLDNAEACYFKAIELKKDFLPTLINLGKLYMSRKQYDNAVLVLTNAVKSSPDSADAQLYLGESYLQVKKGSLAVAHLNEAIRLDPIGKADVHLRLATLYDAAGLKGKAAAEYKMFLEKKPDYAERTQLEKYIADNPPK